jgi:hypothetical protein
MRALEFFAWIPGEPMTTLMRNLDRYRPLWTAEIALA